MKTCQSPWTVMRVAHELASACLPAFNSKFSRHDFTLAQLFACLVLREHLRLTYRRTEALLRDSDWCQRLGMKRVPDHATLWRAFARIVGPGHMNDAIDLIIAAMKRRGVVHNLMVV